MKNKKEEHEINKEATYFINDYLTAQKLENFLETYINYCNKNIQLNSMLLYKQVKVPNTRYRWDFLIEDKYLNKKFIVEFDGDSHYRDQFVIYRDKQKDKIANKLGYFIIRIPYFIQLNSNTFEYYFKFNCPFPIETNFNHGFINKNTKLPESFCQLGMSRFINELFDLPDDIKMDIIISLNNWCKVYPKEYVFNEIDMIEFPLLILKEISEKKE